MGKRGPKPQPTTMKIARGNPGKRALNADEPRLPAPDDRTPPPELQGVALDEWTHHVDALIDGGVLTSVDMTQFKLYCMLVGKVDAIEKHLAKSKRYSATRVKLEGLSLKFQNRLAQQSAAIGVTPSSRSGVKAVKAAPDAAAEKRRRFFGVKQP